MTAFTNQISTALLATFVSPFLGSFAHAAAQEVVIPPGLTVVIDTTFALLQTTSGQPVQVVNGHLVLDRFEVGDGATVRLQGPNPFRLLARDEIEIFGHIDARGFSAKNVAGVNTASFPEPGAAGNLSGGAGGHASIMTTASTAAGNQGFQAASMPGGGGGGESGFGADPNLSFPGGAQMSNPKFRRGAGGGGGRFAADATASTSSSASSVGLVAMPGSNGSSNASGALGSMFPMGGAIGSSPFQDANPRNDFWGVRYNRRTQQLIVGELKGLTGGAGGGGGGDSIRSVSFPTVNFNNSTEDKGGAGGGGGGALHLRAIGRISLFNQVTGSQGSICVNGGDGGDGQLIPYNNNFFTRSGGSGGGGSGGHIVIESSTSIDLGLGAEVLEARGGEGGRYTFPMNVGGGGQGGPGVIQLHAPGGTNSITSVLPLREASIPAPWVLLPRQGLFE